LIGRYRLFDRSPFKGRRLRTSHSFADESAWLSDSLMLGIEAQRVITLRLAAIAQGPTAEAETRLMVTEKMVAALEAAGMLAQGASTRSVISFYRSRVQDNVQRLSQKPPRLRSVKQKLWDGFRAMTSRNGRDKI
jgi:hypothetical protein